MKKIKIVFVLQSLNMGGAEKVTLNIIRNLDQDIFDIHLLLISGFGELSYLLIDTIKICNLNIKHVRNAFTKMLLYLNNVKPDVVFTTLIRLNIVTLLCTLLLKKEIKVIVREPTMPSHTVYKNNKKKYPIWLIKLLYTRAYKIIAQHEEMMNEIIRYYKIKNENVIIMNNPIDYKSIDEMASVKNNILAKNYTNIIASGRLSKEKGFDFLIKSFKKLLEYTEGKKYRLYILGDGTERKSLLELIHKLNINNYVTLTGFIENPYVYYKNANAVVITSEWEGLPNVILEALYLHTPVIVTDSSPVFKQIIHEGENGYIININDEEMLIKRMLDIRMLKLKRKNIIKRNITDEMCNILQATE